jgi:hypothetical protein
MTPAEFFRALFGHPALAGLNFATWEKRNKTSRFWGCYASQGFAAAAEECERLAEASDVYVGTCPYVAAKAHTERGRESDAGALVALWADVDIQNPGAHAASALPRSRDEALEFLDRLPRSPTIVVDSGYGFQAWWLLNEPVLIRTPEERTAARRLVEGWGNHILSQAGMRGWKLDRVFDLARILRVPGTFNHKKGDPVEVKAIRYAATASR